MAARILVHWIEDVSSETTDQGLFPDIIYLVYLNKKLMMVWLFHYHTINVSSFFWLSNFYKSFCAYESQSLIVQALNFVLQFLRVVCFIFIAETSFMGVMVLKPQRTKSLFGSSRASLFLILAMLRSGSTESTNPFSFSGFYFILFFLISHFRYLSPINEQRTRHAEDAQNQIFLLWWGKTHLLRNNW